MEKKKANFARKINDYAPYEFLDHALKVLNHNDVPVFTPSLLSKHDSFKDFSSTFLISIFDKLEADGYIARGKGFASDINMPENNCYHITFEGILLMGSGGYKSKYAKEKRLSRQVLFLQIVIAISTFIAAIYYSIEIYNSITSSTP